MRKNGKVPPKITKMTPKCQEGPEKRKLWSNYFDFKLLKHYKCYKMNKKS